MPITLPGSVLTVKSVYIFAAHPSCLNYSEELTAKAVTLPGSALTVKSVYIFTAHPSCMNYTKELAAKACNSP